MIVQGTMDARINNVIYMELHSGPKMANDTCGKMIVAGTIDRGSTVVVFGGITLMQESTAQMNKLKVHVSSSMTKE
jgi:hypothetical protein